MIVQKFNNAEEFLYNNEEDNYCFFFGEFQQLLNYLECEGDGTIISEFDILYRNWIEELYLIYDTLIIINDENDNFYLLGEIGRSRYLISNPSTFDFY